MKRQLTLAFFLFAFFSFICVMIYSCYLQIFQGGMIRPVISYEKQIINLGNIPTNENIPCDFMLKNTGNCSLKIKAVIPGCGGCLEILSFPKILKRNESGLIKVLLLTEQLNGDVEKVLVVNSNDPSKPAFPLYIRAKVNKNNLQSNSLDLHEVLQE